MTALQTLLINAIDYAGLFPPAKLPMRSTVENYAAYVTSGSSWMLGRLIVPVARLDEFESEAALLLPGSGMKPWHISVLSTGSHSNDLARIRAFNDRYSPEDGEPRAIIDAIEGKAATPDDISAAKELAAAMPLYIEVPLETDSGHLLDAIARIGARAKGRTGGVAEDSFPRSTHLARFMKTCIDAKIPFKATAGLHHPIRGRYRLTYEKNSASGMMYGFLNVLLTAAFLFAGLPIDDAVRVLEEKAVDAFHFEETSVAWRGYHVSIGNIRKTRKLAATAFGSCSFVEPLEELRELRLL
jgi:hypothetical protein